MNYRSLHYTLMEYDKKRTEFAELYIGANVIKILLEKLGHLRNIFIHKITLCTIPTSYSISYYSF